MPFVETAFRDLRTVHFLSIEKKNAIETKTALHAEVNRVMFPGAMLI